jgi:recombination DNA repair RAD52 pathway protein
MAFSITQLRALKRDLKACDIRTREAHGRELSYIEGWHAIAEANRIFGFDAWSRETIESKCILSREIRGAFHVVYVAKVRISVRAEEQVVIREGFGAGEAQSVTLGEAHDKAIKTAETDATKRALATFGKPFGLALYLGHRAKARSEENRNSRPHIERRRTLQKSGSNGRYYVPRRALSPLDPTFRRRGNFHGRHT